MTAVVHSIAEWRNIVSALGREDAIGWFPPWARYMMAMARCSTKRDSCALVVASLFVNPIQFNGKSDYNLYPRVLKDDMAFCSARGVDFIFAPTNSERYPEPQRVFVEVEEISEYLCGRNRPGHFRGIATVVLKLFQILQPRFAFFGEKDYQQLAIVRRLVRDLNVPVDVVGVPTVRECDGLAMSSRNSRLTSIERSLAPCLYKALLSARRSIASGERNAALITAHVSGILEVAPEIKLEYFELVDPRTIRPVEFVHAPVQAVLAAWIGRTRLIDNILCVNRKLQKRPTKITDRVSF